MLRRVSFAALALAAVPACSSKGDPEAGAAPAATTPPAIVHPGDLGAGSAVVDHGGPDRGVVGAPLAGAVGATWQPPSCDGTAELASGVTDAAWTEEAYDAEDPSPRAVHASFRFDASTSLAISWNTAGGTRASWVALGDSPGKLDRFYAGVSFTYATATHDTFAAPMRAHEVHVCGLEPGRTYYYAVGGDGYYGAVQAVKTAPAWDPEATWRVGVVGDSNNIDYAVFEQIARPLGAAAPDWVAFVGDLVHDGTWQSQWDAWFEAAGGLFARSPIMAAHGNHEGMATAYFAQFALPGREEWYSFDYGQAHFVVLNDSPKDDSDLDVQAKFLDEDLTAARARPNPPVWLVAMHHRAPFVSASPNLGVRAKFSPIYDAHHVDLVLNGHEHLYESTYPVRADGTVGQGKGDGTVYVVTAGAGGMLDNPGDVGARAAWSRKLDISYHYLVLEVAGRKLTLKPVLLDGSPIEAPLVLEK